MPIRFSKATSFSKTLTIGVALIGLLSQCVGSKGAGSRQRSKLTSSGEKHISMKRIEEYFVGQGVSQYYLLPYSLTGPKSQSASMDVTFRDSVGNVQFMDIRASLIAPARYAPDDTLLLNTVDGLLAFSPLKILFTEAAKKGTRTRIEARIPQAKARAVIAQLGTGFTIGTKTGRYAFKPTRKAKKRIQNYVLVTEPTVQ